MDKLLKVISEPFKILTPILLTIFLFIITGLQNDIREVRNDVRSLTAFFFEYITK